MERMKILIVIHAAFEKPGFIESWAKQRFHQTLTVSPYKGDTFPDIKDFDFLIVLGGPQSPLKIDKAPTFLIFYVSAIK